MRAEMNEPGVYHVRVSTADMREAWDYEPGATDYTDRQLEAEARRAEGLPRFAKFREARGELVIFDCPLLTPGDFANLKAEEDRRREAERLTKEAEERAQVEADLNRAAHQYAAEWQNARLLGTEVTVPSADGEVVVRAGDLLEGLGWRNLAISHRKGGFGSYLWIGAPR